MGRKRSIRHRGKRRSKEVIDLDISSLLDVLFILLVFLLKSYNSSGVILNVPKGVTLPTSKSMTQITSGIIIQASPEKIWVDNVEVVNLEEKRRGNYDHGGRRIIPLFNELVRKKEAIIKIYKTTPGAKKFSGVINLIVDKSFKFNFLKKIMYTAADAGFKQYKFVVLGDIP